MGKTVGGKAPESDARSRLIAPVGVTITVVWAASAIVGLLSGNFTGLEVVTPVMLAFVGYLFGINIVRTGEKKEPRRLPTPRRSPSE